MNSHADTFPVLLCYLRPVCIQNTCRQLFWATNYAANTLPTKKGTKQILNNQRPVSFLPICGKHFDRVWQEGLIYKTKCMAVTGLFYRVFFIRKATKSCSEWTRTLQSQLVCLRVQFFGPSFFLKCINDLSGNLEAYLKLFADDTSMFSVVSNPINTS